MVRKITNQFNPNFRPGTTRVEGKVPLSHGGAVGTVAIPGVTSVVKAGTGLYTINLERKYKGLVGWSASLQNTATDGYGIILKDDQYVDGVAGTNDGNGYLQLQVLQMDGAGAQELTNGLAIWFALDLKTSSAG